MKRSTEIKLRKLVERIIKEETGTWEIEAYGVKGMKSSPWRKKF